MWMQKHSHFGVCLPCPRSEISQILQRSPVPSSRKQYLEFRVEPAPRLSAKRTHSHTQYTASMPVLTTSHRVPPAFPLCILIVSLADGERLGTHHSWYVHLSNQFPPYNQVHIAAATPFPDRCALPPILFPSGSGLLEGGSPPEPPPLYLSPDILPCITALALLRCSYPRHALLHHIPSSLHVGPDPQTSLPPCGQTSWPAQAAPQVDTLLTGFRSLQSHPCGQTCLESQEERPPSQQAPYWRGWGRRGRILGSSPPVLKLLLLLLPFCSGYWRLSSPVNWNVMNSSDHCQPVQCVRGTTIVFGTISRKINQDLGSRMMFLQKVSLESGTRKKIGYYFSSFLEKVFFWWLVFIFIWNTPHHHTHSLLCMKDKLKNSHQNRLIDTTLSGLPPFHLKSSPFNSLPPFQFLWLHPSLILMPWLFPSPLLSNPILGFLPNSIANSGIPPRDQSIWLSLIQRHNPS